MSEDIRRMAQTADKVFRFKTPCCNKIAVRNITESWSAHSTCTFCGEMLVVDFTAMRVQTLASLREGLS